MTREIFRQKALERLASPEFIDRPVRLVPPAAWLGLAAFLVAVISAAAWAMIAEAPVKITGQGIIVREGGLFEITASDPGRIRELLLRPGQTVAKGEAVALIDQSDLRRQHQNAEASLVAAKVRFERTRRHYEESNERMRTADRERLETNWETEWLLRDRLILLEKRRDNIRRLVDKKLISDLQLIESEVALSNTLERLADLDDERVQIRLGQIEDESERDIELLNQKLRVEEFEREVDRLSKLLIEREVLASPHQGRIVEVKVNPGDIVQAGSALATVSPQGAEIQRELYALLYIPPRDGKRVRPGMPVKIDLTTVKREEYGYVLGTVVDVAPLPATFEGMRRTLQNDQLVEQLSGEGAPFQATLALQPDSATRSGFKWSTSRGAEIDINAGTLFEGQVVVRHLRLISFLVPEVERVVGGDVF